MLTKENNLHVLNIALMAVALVLAILIPFELFLIAYAVLGPLHYLTEINWLNERKFFIEKKNQVWILVALTLVISLPILCSGVLRYFNNSYIAYSLAVINRFYGCIVFMGLLISIGLVYSLKPLFLALLTGLGIVVSYFCLYLNSYQFFVGLFLPSLVHVYLFTLMFIAYGVIKSGSKMGFLEVILLSLIPVIIFLCPVDAGAYTVAKKTMATFIQSKFGIINMTLGAIFGGKQERGATSFLLTEMNIKIQIFIAFAYFYHYLNWFSKVSVIGWFKNTSTIKVAFIVVGWVLSVSLYYYDYRIGLAALFFLSLLHVILEFPLNVVAVHGVLAFLGKKLFLSRK